MKTKALVTLAALPLVLAACEKAGGTKSEIEMIDTGSGEKHSLQLDFEAGDVQTAEMILDMKMDIPGMLSMDMDMKFGYQLEILDVEEKGGERVGHFKLTFTEVDLSMTPSNPQVEQLLGEFKKLEGEGLLASMDQKGKQGYVKPASDRVYPLFKALGMDTKQVEQMFQDIYPDIPPEAVGVGGSWRIEKKTRQGQNDLKINMTYKLVEANKLPDGTVEITLDLSGRAKVKGGGVEGGGDVSGRIVYVPARGRAKSGRIVTDITAGSGGQTVNMNLAFEYREKEFRGK